LKPGHCRGKLPTNRLSGGTWYLTTLSGTSAPYMASNDWITVNNQLQKLCKEIIFKVLSRNSRGGTEKTTETLEVPDESEIGLSAEIEVRVELLHSITTFDI
jgi:hypothetical protein